MNYGLPYLGSKSKIAKEIIALFPSADNFYDLFAGGCAITHALLLDGHNQLFKHKYRNIIINDINNVPQLFIDAINGKYKNEKRWISREMFFENLKKENPDPYIQWIWSFSNNGKSYLFSKGLEPIKKAFHYVVMFDDWTYFNKLYDYQFLQEMLTEYGIDNHKVFLDLYKKQFIKGGKRKEHLRVIKWIQKNLIKNRYSFSELERLEQLEQLERLQQLEQLEQLERLQQLEQLQQLERLQQLEQLQQLERLQQDYKTIEIQSNSIIYCDIPYNIPGTKDYLKEKFNHKEFWEWAEKQTHPVYVSEYNYTGDNPDKWKIVYQKEKISLRGLNNRRKRNIRIEKVFWNKKGVNIHNK